MKRLTFGHSMRSEAWRNQRAVIATVLLITAGSFSVVCVGCAKPAEKEVVVYTTVDKESSAPIFSAFHRKAGGEIQPTIKSDRSMNQAGELTDQIIAEQGQPIADVFWNGEVLQTIRLQKLGLLQPHSWNVASGYPNDMQAKDGTWCGFAARARVLLVNTRSLTDPSDYPQSVDELADPKWNQNCGIARPLVGTSATHAAVIRELKGEEAALRWFKAVSENAVVYPTNQSVAIAVATGKVAWGVTDSDFAITERDDDRPVAIVFPDQATDAPGTLRIPNTLAIIKGSPHPVAAAMLVDYLVAPQTEDRLAMGSGAQLPLSRLAEHRPRILPEAPVRWMRVDFESAAGHWESFALELSKLFP
jgi:iron(III) transport system substrate-binding protein